MHSHGGGNQTVFVLRACIINVKEYLRKKKKHLKHVSPTVHIKASEKMQKKDSKHVSCCIAGTWVTKKTSAMTKAFFSRWAIWTVHFRANALPLECQIIGETKRRTRCQCEMNEWPLWAGLKPRPFTPEQKSSMFLAHTAIKSLPVINTSLLHMQSTHGAAHNNPGSKREGRLGGEKSPESWTCFYIRDGAEAVFCFAAISHYFYQPPAWVRRWVRRGEGDRRVRTFFFCLFCFFFSFRKKK